MCYNIRNENEGERNGFKKIRSIDREIYFNDYCFGIDDILF